MDATWRSRTSSTTASAVSKSKQRVAGHLLRHADGDRDLAALGELHGVADIVDQHLPHPQRVADQPRRERSGSGISMATPWPTVSASL